MLDWIKIALALPVSHSHRIDCNGCGGIKTASVTNMGKTYVKFCFKCKETHTEFKPPMTPKERLALQRAADAFEAQEPTLPADFTTDIPVQGLLWLSKGGLHVDDIKHYGFGWSDTIQRVVMPVLSSTGTLTGVQARRVDPNGFGPKYLGQVWSGPRPVWRSTHTSLGRAVVLTEDILSAARVGKVNEAWSLLGTNLMPAVISQIGEANPDEVIVWMDNDEAGWYARKKMLRQLGAVGINARSIQSDRDPKLHTIQEMKDLINA